MILDCGEVTNQELGGRKHHPAKGALGKYPLALSLISSISKVSLSLPGEQLGLSWSGEHVDVCVQHDAHDIPRMTGTVSWTQSHLAEFQLTGAPNCLGVIYRNFVLFGGLMITKGGLKNHSSSVIFQVRTKVKALLWIFLTILSAVFIRVCPQRWEFHWV